MLCVCEVASEGYLYFINWLINQEMFQNNFKYRFE